MRIRQEERKKNLERSDETEKKKGKGETCRFFFDGHRRGWHHRTMSNDVGLVFDDPFDDLALLELHRFGDCGGEVNVVLIGFLLAGDELNFSWVSHDV